MSHESTPQVATTGRAGATAYHLRGGAALVAAGQRHMMSSAAPDRVPPPLRASLTRPAEDAAATRSGRDSDARWHGMSLPRFPHDIDGAFADAETEFEIVAPATGEAWATVPAAGAGDVERAPQIRIGDPFVMR